MALRSSVTCVSAWMRQAEKTGLNFIADRYARPRVCPAGLSSIDREKYGMIPGVTDRDYYTNSFHVPVYYPISAFEKIRLRGAVSRADQRRSYQLH